MSTAPARLCGSSKTDLAEYLRQVRPIALLTVDEEKSLAREFRTSGCEAARERLICANLRLVVYAAKRYALLGVPLQDLVEAGNVGLIQAVSRFDPEQGVRFSTYAMWWIKRSILNCLDEHGRLIRIPKKRRDAERAGRLAAQKVDAVLNPAPVPEVPARRGPVVIFGEDGARCLEALGDQHAPRPDDALGSKETRERVRRALKALPNPEGEIVRLRFGLSGRSPLSVNDVGRELGMPKAQVLRLLQAALRRLELVLGEPNAPIAERRRRPLAVAC